VTAAPTDDLGEPVPLAGRPIRVVSLVPSITEAVAASVPGVLVGATDYCTHPAELDVARVGGSKYPKLPAVRAAAPDLVLANAEENRPEDVAALRADGIPVWVTEAAATVPIALASIRRLLAEAFDAAPDWLDRAEAEWDGPPPPVRVTAIVPVWRKPWVLLGRDTLLLEYRLGETRSFLWAVTPGSLKTFNLPGRAEIDSTVRPACDLLASSHSPTSVKTQLAKLSHLLLDPVAPLLPGKRLLVVGDGILQSVPFGALQEPGGSEPFIPPGGQITHTQGAVPLSELIAKFMFGGVSK